MKKIFSLLFVFLVFSTSVVIAKKDTKKETKNTKKSLTSYEKLFKDKQCKTVKGLLTLHKIDGRLYFEFPLNLLEKEMLLGSMIESISNSDYGVAGMQTHQPVCIYFTMADSAIQIRRSNFLSISEDENIATALQKNNRGAILSAFEIKAVSPDSSAVVFDATDFFVDGREEVDPFEPVGGLYTRTHTFNKSRSLLGDIMVFEDNVSITSHLSYEVNSYFFGMMYEEKVPASAIMKRSLMLLPENEMRPRLNDPRIGVFYNGHLKFSEEDNGAKAVYYANRWRLEPKNIDAYKAGKLTEPVEPILFYIDDKFPEKWVKHVKEGVEIWNRAFEKIGFKNAVVAKMYPKDDPEFDPNNIKYNCVKYAPTLTQNSMGPSWIDPRTGEILNAAVYMYHGVVDLLSDWLFIQTSVADKRVRTTQIPDEVMGRAIRYIASHEMGHCLGLMHNMSASFSIPVDSLRSPTFTQKYGTTSSIMDYARFNFVAREGDFERGVQLTPPDLGVYDDYVIKWLYSPILTANTSEEELPILEKWVSEKIGDPMYRYGKQQIYTNYDPSSQTEDLGDDQIKATRYAMDNLKYITKNINDWVKDEDEDYSFRKKTGFAIANIHFYWYMTHVLTNIGGIYQYEKYEGDEGPAYKSVPEDIQRESMLYILELLENTDWLNDAEFAGNSASIFGEASEYFRSVLFPFVLRKIAAIGLSEHKAIENPYSQKECIEDVFNYVWGETIKGKTPTNAKFSMQRLLIDVLTANSKVNKEVASGDGKTSIADLNQEQRMMFNFLVAREKERLRFADAVGLQENLKHPSSNDYADYSGFGFLRSFKYQTADLTHIYYAWLLKTKSILEKVVKQQKGDLRKEYEFLLYKVNKTLSI